MRSNYARPHGAIRYGVATSAYQTEGGLHANNWAEWETHLHADGRHAILDGSRCGRATNSWERFDDDLACLTWLGVDVYRFSVEWSRVEPLPGYFDEAALDRYRSWCVALRARGIAPMVTLHHFTEPSWFSRAGGFIQPDGARAWLRFVAHVAERLGDVVDEWVTVNEPVGYAVQGWVRGLWPPGLCDPATAARVVEHLLLAHAQAYRVLHRAAAERGTAAADRCRVGLAHHVVVFRPRRPASPLDRWAARSVDDAYNHAVLRALATGHLRLRLPGLRLVTNHPALVGSQDFLGLNHYQPLYVSMRLTRRSGLPLLQVEPSSAGVKDDLGYDLDPGSLAEAIRLVSPYGLPLHVTENGTCDGATPDERRCHQLEASVGTVRDLARNRVDVRSYLHWTLVDSFEWAYGWSARFGLFRVDPDTGARTPTAAAALYRALVAESRGHYPTGDGTSTPGIATT